jgi:hypothetical protein
MLEAQLGIKPTIFYTLEEHANHYNAQVAGYDLQLGSCANGRGFDSQLGSLRADDRGLDSQLGP